jgi:glycosyltransferase involved in cell wall biosynthesis
MRICLCISYFPPAMGGAERQASLLAAGLANLGEDVTVVTRHLPGLPTREFAGRVRIHRAIRPGRRGVLFGLGYVLSMLVFFMNPLVRFDVVLAYGIHLHAYLACQLRRRRGFQVVVRPMSFGPIGDLATLAQMRFWPIWRKGDAPTRQHVLGTILGADAFVAFNRHLATELIAHGISSGRIFRIPNGVPLPETPWDPSGVQAMRHSLGIPGGPMLLFVGRLDQHKGAGDLLRALPTLIKRYPKLTAVLLGDGPLRTELTSLAVELGVSAHVRLPGVADPTPFLHAADVFVLPTLGEGMSNALLEAMAAGLPCVTTRVPGNIEVVTHGETGLLAEPGEPEELQGAVARVLDDPNLGLRMGQEARRRVRAVYSVDRMVSAYRNLFARLAAGEVTDIGGPGRTGG